MAGANAAGGNMRFPGAIGTSILKVGGLIAARTGLNAREAAAAGLDYECLYVPGFSHATYYDCKFYLCGRIIGPEWFR